MLKASPGDRKSRGCRYKYMIVPYTGSWAMCLQAQAYNTSKVNNMSGNSGSAALLYYICNHHQKPPVLPNPTASGETPHISHAEGSPAYNESWAPRNSRRLQVQRVHKFSLQIFVSSCLTGPYPPRIQIHAPNWSSSREDEVGAILHGPQATAKPRKLLQLHLRCLEQRTPR
jgi:hypothetical protein